MKTIKICLMNKSTSVMTLITIYENNRKLPESLYRVLSYVVYTLMENYILLTFCHVNKKT